MKMDSQQYQYSSPKDYHHHQYYEACDLFFAELDNRVEKKIPLYCNNY